MGAVRIVCTSLGQGATFLTRDVHEHAALKRWEGWATRNSDNSCEIFIDSVEIEIFDHATAASGVRIDIERDPLAICKGLLDSGERFRYFAPVGLSCCFVMRDVRVDGRILADR